MRSACYSWPLRGRLAGDTLAYERAEIIIIFTIIIIIIVTTTPYCWPERELRLLAAVSTGATRRRFVDGPGAGLPSSPASSSASSRSSSASYPGRKLPRTASTSETSMLRRSRN